MDNIKVSIIVPVYNVEKYVLKCLESLKDQTLKDIEIIVVNDGSTDNSKLLCENFVKKNKLEGSFFLYDKPNGGLSDARNYGLKFARGEYICFLDADDWVESKTYELLYNYSVKGGYIITECAYYLTYEKSETIVKLPSLISLSEFAAKGMVIAWNKLFRKDFLIGKHLAFLKGCYYEDVDFFYLCLENISDYNYIGHLDISLIHYTQRKESISNRPSLRILDILKVYNHVLQSTTRFNKEIEYRCVRNLYGHFLFQALKISGFKNRRLVVRSFKSFIKSNFSKWRKNPYFREFSTVNLIIRYFTSIFI